MKINEVVVSRSVRVNLGDYQAVDFFVSMKAEIDELDTPAEAALALRRHVEDAIATDIRVNFKKRGKVISEQDIRKRYGI
jgi:hypothetical protein